VTPIAGVDIVKLPKRLMMADTADARAPSRTSSARAAVS